MESYGTVYPKSGLLFFNQSKLDVLRKRTLDRGTGSRYIRIWNITYVSYVYTYLVHTPESKKKQTSVYLIKRKIKKKMLVYIPGT